MTNSRQRRLPFKDGRLTRPGHKPRGWSMPASLMLRVTWPTNLWPMWGYSSCLFVSMNAVIASIVAVGFV